MGGPNSDDGRESLELCLLCSKLHLVYHKDYLSAPSIVYASIIFSVVIDGTLFSAVQYVLLIFKEHNMNLFKKKAVEGFFRSRSSFIPACSGSVKYRCSLFAKIKFFFITKHKKHIMTLFISEVKKSKKGSHYFIGYFRN